MNRKYRPYLSIYMWNYLFILPGVVLLFVFSYMPMVGLLAAFKDYKVYQGLWSSSWAGLDHFYFLSDPYFWKTVKNTVLITFYRLIFGFSAPIILAVMLNEVRNKRFKSFIQSTSYLPHFISWIVVAYMLQNLLALDTGVVNSILQLFGLPPEHFLGKEEYFRGYVVLSSIWKDVGWGAIIYLAALTNIDPQQHESAVLDGAGRFTRIWHIDLPGIMPTIVILFILQMPTLLQAGYDQIYPLVNPSNIGVSEVLDVYIINLGLSQGQYSTATAIGMLLSAVQLFMILSVNYIIKRMGHEGIW